VRGAAYVLPVASNPLERGGHRVYLKGMLLSESASKLLPEWAFFARCVVDTTELRPTASREAMYEDTLLEETRTALGDQLRDWLVRLATEDRRRITEFLNVHRLGVKALALHDDEMLRLVERYWPMETNIGRMTLADFRAEHSIVRYVVQVEDFRQIGAVAAAQGMPLVNAGYEFDTKIIERLPQAEPGTLIERVEPSDLTTHFDQLELGVELAQRPFVARAQRTVDRLGCEVVLRSFDPAGLPALYLVNSSAAFAAELRATRDRVDDVWAEVLDALAKTDEADRPQLVLNYRNPLVRRLAGLTDPELVALTVEALYGQALLLGYHPIRPADAALLNRSFIGLLEQAVPAEENR
jgi:molecular chaperone HtpG